MRSSILVGSRPSATWATFSKLPRRQVQGAWFAFALLNLLAMIMMIEAETIPFHFIWVSFTLVHGFWPWRRRTMLAILSGVCLCTAAVLVKPVTDGQLNVQEMAEVPLMAAMFLAMAWHAERRQRAVEVAQRLADSEHEARERERDFVRDASHEIRSPITLVRGHLELLLRSGLDAASTEDANVALSELNRLSRISDGLLTIARMEQPNGLRLVPVDLAEILSRSIRHWSGAASRRWLLDVGTDVTVRADPDRVEAAVDALLENAVQHTEEGGLIALTLRADGPCVVLGVADDGVGVPPAHRDRIFERFYRRNNERNPSGSGLGLSIVQAIATAHDGEVSVGTGTRGGAAFSMRLPVHGPADSDAILAPA